MGTGLTLTPSGMVGDGNGGNNYTYTFVPDTTGVITPGPDDHGGDQHQGLRRHDDAAASADDHVGQSARRDTANFTETYDTRNVGTGMTLTPSGTVNDGNGGNNYTYTFVPDVTGVITGRIDDHGGGQHQDLRRHDERGGERRRSPRAAWPPVTRPTSPRPTARGTSAPA